MKRAVLPPQTLPPSGEPPYTPHLSAPAALRPIPFYIPEYTPLQADDLL